MTYQESDVVDIVDRVDGILDEDHSPELKLQLIQETINLYHKVPLYPGIAEMVSHNLLEETSFDELNLEEYVSISSNGEVHSGVINEIDNGEIHVKNIYSEDNKIVRISKSDIDQIRKINEEALADDWPELDFSEETTSQ
ncbi:MAG: hypothetical protein ABEJ65_11620 [bacterium]